MDAPKTNGRGKPIAAIIGKTSVVQLSCYPDGRFEMDRDGRSIGLRQPYDAKECMRTLLSYASVGAWGDRLLPVCGKEGENGMVCGDRREERLRPSNHVVSGGSRTANAPRQYDKAPTSHLRSVRVLLVEDHVVIARITGCLLRILGYEVSVAHRASDGVELASDESYDVVVCDIGLPDACGHEMMRRIRDRFGLLGVAVTGFTEEEFTLMETDSGFVEFLLKPIDVNQLDAAIQRVVRRADILGQRPLDRSP